MRRQREEKSDLELLDRLKQVNLLFYLNSLLFDGKSILPKAATPMTASLTRLTYGEKPKAVVNYYDKDDWDSIEYYYKEYLNEKNKIIERLREEKKQRLRNSQENNSRFEPADYEPTDKEIKSEIDRIMPEEYKASFVSKNIPEKEKLFGLREEIDVDNIDELMDKLSNYVGVNGKYTPLTKSLDLYLNIESLKDIEVIDTPGVNDPIVSRGHITDKFLKKCDAAFLLCYTGQFMGKQDTDFLLNSLPSEGIKNIVILGSKFDSAVLDEVKNKEYNNNLIKILRGLTDKLKEQAKKTILPKLEKEINTKEIYKTLKENLKIEFISALFYSLGKKDEKDYDDDENHIYKVFKEKFPDFISKENFIDFSNIIRIKEKEFTDILNRKNEILKDKVNDILQAKKNFFVNKKKEIEDDLKYKLEKITSENIDSIRKKQKDIIENLNKKNEDIEDIFDHINDDIDDKLVEKINELKSEARNYGKVKVENKTEEYEVEVKRGGVLGWLGDFFLGKKREIRTKTITYVNIREIIDQIEEYTDKINGEINNFWRIIVKELKGDLNKQSRLEKQILSTIIDAFDTSQVNFDSQFLKSNVRKVIKQLEYPEINIDSTAYINRIVNTFGKGSINESEIDNLKGEVSDIIKELLNNMVREVEKLKKEFLGTFKKHKESFINNVSQKLNEEISILEKQIKEKESYITKYKNILEKLQNIV